MALWVNDSFQIETQICSISLYVITQGLVKFPLSGGNHLSLTGDLSVAGSSHRAAPPQNRQSRAWSH